MWRTVVSVAAIEEGIAERRFGPVQVNVIASAPDYPALNNVLGAAEEGAVKGGNLEKAIAWADSFGVDYRVSVARDLPEMAAAESLLDHLGFEQGQGVVKYVRDTSPPDFPGVKGARVWEIGDDAGLAGETMSLSAAPAIGMPNQAWDLLFSLPVQEHWHSFTVEFRGNIVAFGSLLVNDGVAELGLDGTLGYARGHGCNLALLRQRILAAREAGCHTIFAESIIGPEEGIATAGRNLVRAGFIPACHSMYWQRPRL